MRLFVPIELLQVKALIFVRQLQCYFLEKVNHQPSRRPPLCCFDRKAITAGLSVVLTELLYGDQVPGGFFLSTLRCIETPRLQSVFSVSSRNGTELAVVIRNEFAFPDCGKSMIAGKTLSVFLCIFGLSSSVNARINKALRILLIVMNALSISNGFAYLIFYSRIRHPTECLSYFTYLYETVLDATVYSWRLYAGGLRKSSPLKQSWRFSLVFAVIFCVDIQTFIGMLVYVSKQPVPVASYFGVRQLTIFLNITEVCQSLTQIQRFIVCVEMAIALTDLAKEIGDANLKNCSAHELGELCRSVDTNCASLSGKLWLPLTLIHVGYFLHLMTQIPTQIVAAESYHLSMMVKKFAELMIVVNAGDNFMKAAERLGRELRKRGEFFESSTRELQLFSKSEHSITFGIGNRLTYRSCCCFLGLSWGFMLTVFQSTFDTEGCTRKDLDSMRLEILDSISLKSNCNFSDTP